MKSLKTFFVISCVHYFIGIIFSYLTIGLVLKTYLQIIIGILFGYGFYWAYILKKGIAGTSYDKLIEKQRMGKNTYLMWVTFCVLSPLLTIKYYLAHPEYHSLNYQIYYIIGIIYSCYLIYLLTNKEVKEKITKQ
ncbi:MAG: hypothetical protein ACI9F2_000352 [Lysobacterales bacterium]|jgi:hypothetical protein